ncbi:hypothetical protein LHA01_13900 [Schleiferilactobacillus harbinensis]|nr:hypothetical protein LHA01_13900 [Schleiferilactobacillus harbinensis]
MYNDGIKSLVQLLKDSGYQVFQDVARPSTPYPYLVYSFVSDKAMRRSNTVLEHHHLYQLSLFTAHDADDLVALTNVLDDHGVLYEPWASQSANENDDVITNFYTYITVLG